MNFYHLFCVLSGVFYRNAAPIFYIIDGRPKKSKTTQGGRVQNFTFVQLYENSKFFFWHLGRIFSRFFKSPLFSANFKKVPQIPPCFLRTCHFLRFSAVNHRKKWNFLLEITGKVVKFCLKSQEKLNRKRIWGSNDIF